MVKNLKGGKHKGQARKNTEANKGARELVFSESGEQIYAHVTKKLGDGRFLVTCFDTNEPRIALIRGSFRSRVWINLGDIVLVSLRDFNESKCDIIHKYSKDEAKSLKNLGEIPSNVNLSATDLELQGEEHQVDNHEEVIFDSNCVSNSNYTRDSAFMQAL